MSAAPALTPEPYDFRRPRFLSQPQRRVLHAVHEGFARRLAVYFSSQLRTLVEITVGSVAERTYEEYVASSRAPSALFPVRHAGTDQRFLLEVAPDLALFAMEKMLGGQGSYSAAPRVLSQIEQRLICRLADRAFFELMECWQPHASLVPDPEGYEPDVQFVQLLAGTAPVVVVPFEAHVREQTAPLNLCYPLTLIQHLLGPSKPREAVSGQPAPVPPPQRAEYEDAVRGTSVELRAELGRTQLALSDLLGLAVGDVIPLRQRPADALALSVGGRLRFKASAGRSGNRCALQIVEVVEPQRPAPHES